LREEEKKKQDGMKRKYQVKSHLFKVNEPIDRKQSGKEQSAMREDGYSNMKFLLFLLLLALSILFFIFNEVVIIKVSRNIRRITNILNIFKFFWF